MISEAWLFGRRAEDEALAWYLLKHPHARLVAKNFRVKGGEIDLVLEDLGSKGIELVFIEVRARHRGAWVDALSSITVTKQRRIQLAIRHYLARYRGRAQTLRVDLMAWDEGPEGLQWSHVSNARLEGDRG